MNDDQGKDSGTNREVVRRALPRGASNRDDGGGEGEGNPVYAFLRFSKTLAPWYRILLSLSVFFGGLGTLYDKIVTKINDHDAAILKSFDDNYKIKFHDYDQNIEKSEELEGRIYNLEQAKNGTPIPLYNWKGKKIK